MIEYFDRLIREVDSGYFALRLGQLLLLLLGVTAWLIIGVVGIWQASILFLNVSPAGFISLVVSLVVCLMMLLLSIRITVKRALLLKSRADMENYNLLWSISILIKSYADVGFVLWTALSFSIASLFFVGFPSSTFSVLTSFNPSSTSSVLSSIYAVLFIGSNFIIGVVWLLIMHLIATLIQAFGDTTSSLIAIRNHVNKLVLETTNG